MELELNKTIYIIACILAGLFLSVFATALFCLLRKVFFVPMIRQKLLDKAIAQNHVVTARRISPARMSYGSRIQNKESALYQYEVNNRVYKKLLSNTMELSDEVPLYYVRNPRKACSKLELGLWESNWLLYYCILAVIITIVFYYAGASYVKII